MSFPLRNIRITDETGTNYTDLFADIDLDSFDLLGDRGIRAVDAMVVEIGDRVDVGRVEVLPNASDELEFINIFGHVERGRRGYRLRTIADALGLLIEFDLH
ncbi:hypothetical protein ACLQ2Q_21895 [Microbacterium sp. DT81.1]|uniref:hypothetical protein n=1 Tax=Microbacterium sp. DT81.1 TaxID=3393413 RepID=UPI003CE759F0